VNAEGSTVLLVEDEHNLALGIAENLEAEGVRVEVVGDGVSALEHLRGQPYDLVILDVMLPGLDGFTVCDEARKSGCDVPILFLTARDSVDDRIHGLELGGDDYLPKPFHLRELLARVQAILRRRTWYASASSAGASLSFGGNEVSFRTYEARSFDHRDHQLTQKEAMILKLLSDREGEVVTRAEILDRVWGYDLYPSTRTIDNFIVRLRKRFEPDPENPHFFHTMRGVGYRFTRGDAEP